MVKFSDKLLEDIGFEMGANIQYIFEISSELYTLKNEVNSEFSGKGKDAIIDCIEDLIRLFEGYFNPFLENYKGDLINLTSEFDKLDEEVSKKVSLSS